MASKDFRIVMPAWPPPRSRVGIEKGQLASRAASLRPMVDLPAPIMPTSTMRTPSPRAARMSASGARVLAIRRRTLDLAHGISPICRQRRHSGHLYDYPRGPRQRTLATKRRTCWMISLVNLRPFMTPSPRPCPMPSLFRFLTVVAVIAGIDLWRGVRAGQFRQSEAAGNDGHDPAGQVPQEIGASSRACANPPRTSKPSDAKLTGLFLDMLAAEQGAGRQYARRLQARPHRFLRISPASATALPDAETQTLRELPRRPRCARLQIVQRGAPAVGDAAPVSFPAERADPQRRSRGNPVRPEARPRPAQGAVDIRRRPHADAGQGAERASPDQSPSQQRCARCGSIACSRCSTPRACASPNWWRCRARPPSATPA